MSVERGAKIFMSKCSQCHNIEKEGGNGQGPNLYGVIGRKSGTVSMYNYTAANLNSGINSIHSLYFVIQKIGKKY